MEKIGLDKLKIYQKYEGEYALLFEPWANKKDQEKISDIEFSTLQLVTDNLAMIRSNSYSAELVNEMKKEIDFAKEKMTIEVFNLLVNCNS